MPDICLEHWWWRGFSTARQECSFCHRRSRWTYSHWCTRELYLTVCDQCLDDARLEPRFELLHYLLVPKPNVKSANKRVY